MRARGAAVAASAIVVAVVAVVIGHRTVARPMSARPFPPRPAPPSTTATDGPTSGLHQAWHWEPPPVSNVGMPAADADGVAVTYGHVGVALVGPDGRERWRADRTGVREVAPLLEGDLVVVATDEGLVAWDRADGHRRWEVALADRANTPVAAGPLLLATTWDGSLSAVRRADGGPTWSCRLPGVALGPPATDGVTVVASWEAEGGEVAGLAAFDAATGAARWSRPLPAEGVSAPAVAGADDPLVVVVAGDGRLHGFDLADGGARWQVPVGGPGAPEVPPLVDGRVLVAGHRLGGMAGVDLTGRRRWEETAEGGTAVRGGAAPAGGHGYVLPLDSGELLVATAGGGTQVLDPPGRVSGVAAGPSGVLLVATGGEDQNHLFAVAGWQPAVE